jgi:hypothetical protein
MKKYIIFLIILAIIIYYLYFNKKDDINKFILPFGYQYSDSINTSDKNDFYKLLKKFGTNKDIELTDKLMKIERIYSPTWGIKIDKNNKIEFEMYFYIYNPINRNYENDSITVNKLNKVLDINKIHKPNMTMYSIDYDNYKEPNYYYFTSSDDIKDVGYSEKEGKLNNHYYRYYPDTIDNKFINYIDTKLINYKINNIKTIFVADKLLRNYYGIYYDGITYDQLEYFIDKYNYNKNIIKDLSKNKNYSISIDYNKKNNEIERIGIYGILF